MRPARAVVLDHEAVLALRDPAHPKHRRVIGAVEVVPRRSLRSPGAVELVVPTAVRVEAGWDRRSPRAAGVNRLHARDAVLDRPTANVAADLRAALQVSVADAHLGAVLPQLMAPVAVLTSDPRDVQRVAAHVGMEVTVVRL